MTTNSKDFFQGNIQGPFDLLEPDHAKELLELCKSFERKFSIEKKYKGFYDYLDHVPEVPWFKSLHNEIPEILKLASSPVILNRIEPIIGKNILLWGASKISRPPKSIHRWHVDVESLSYQCVNVWIGLSGITGKSSVKVLSNSCNLSPPQFLITDGHIDDLLNDNKIVDLAKRKSNELVDFQVKTADIEGDGKFIIFNGRSWHGSNNQTDKTRSSLLLQYANPDQEVRIPVRYNFPVIWSDYWPPCYLVRGKPNNSNNNIVNLSEFI